jgi:DNA-binding NarL/FixJ family response regulator
MTTRTRIYLVDDHPIFRLGLRQIIQADSTFDVVGEAGDDGTAAAGITRLKPDIAIVDVGLPKNGGLALVRSLRSACPGLACIMLTMNAEESTFNAAIEAGAQGYILKDDALDLVTLGLRAVAAGTIFLSPAISGWLVRRQQRVSVLKETKTGLAALTPTERLVLLLVRENKTNKEIAAELFVSHRTVETHRSNICAKLGLQGSHKLLQFAIEHRSEL